MRKLAIIMTLFVLATSGAAMANSLTGPTGLISIPSADVNAPGVVGTAVNVVNGRILASLDYSLYDMFELGILANTGGSDTRISGFAKVQLFPETNHDPGLAVGLDDQSLYAVVSKTMAPMWRGHVGVGTGRLRGIFGGVTYLVNPVVVKRSSGMQPPQVLLMADFDRGGPNVGARLAFAQGLDVNVSMLNLYDFAIGAAWRTRF